MTDVLAGPAATDASSRSRFANRWGPKVIEVFEEVRDPNEVASRLGIPERSVRRYLAGENLLHLALPSGGDALQSRRWERHEILGLMRAAAADVGQPLSLSKFDRWIQARPQGGPSQRTVIVHFGSWREACAQAGVAAGESSRDYSPGVTEASCLAAVAAYVAECAEKGRKPTMTGYEHLSTERGWPCRNSVTLKVGPWRNVVKSVMLSDGSAPGR